MVKMASIGGEPMKSCFSYFEIEKMLEKSDLLIYEHLSPEKVNELYFNNREDYLSAFETIHYIHAIKNKTQQTWCYTKICRLCLQDKSSPHMRTQAVEKISTALFFLKIYISSFYNREKPTKGRCFLMFHTRNSSQHEAEFVLLDQLVEEDHLLRKIDQYIDFSFIVDKVRPYYSENKGRPSLDPLILFKMMFIGYLYGIRSERQLEKEIYYNMAYRWF